VSGGETVAGKPTEADVGAQYIERILPAVVVRERRARTTPDNVTFTLALLRPPVDVLTIIGRRTQLWRVRAILWRRRDRLRALGSPEVRTMSVDGESLVTAILDMVLLPVDLLDPLGRSFVYRLLKKVARNG
jgi:hypothetical protein